MDKNIFKTLQKLDLPTKDYVVIGSGPLIAREIIEPNSNSDLDIVARGSAWKKAQSMGEIHTLKHNNQRVIKLINNEVEIFDNCWPGSWDNDYLIDNADVINGYKFMNLETLAKYKRLFGRKKDLQHLKLLRTYLKNKN